MPAQQRQVHLVDDLDEHVVRRFATYSLPYREDPLRDVDRASYGLVKVFEDRLGDTYPDPPWEPKAAFAALAEAYHR
ncbi:hypothetical protein ACH4OY_21405 [Micromonospora rubida]|uniref:Uncharacterized protein n=1 Tax=Micromonospora rubida TaxID=2697657 RepID=A0ABW7SNH3_9ACTN